jgi:hypothetical protein
MRLARDPEDGWDSRISSPVLSEGFAAALQGLGYRARFAEDQRDRALILLRTVPLPFLRRWTLRAKVYIDRGHNGFLRDLLVALRRRGVAHVKINDERHGLWYNVPSTWPGVTQVTRWVFLVDAAGRTDADLRKAMQDPVPRNIRKAERAGVEVKEIASERDLDAFCALMAETSDRMRRRSVPAVFPDGFFRGVFQQMVPKGQALFLLAWAGTVPLAGQMYLLSPDRLIYYHGASTRDRALTPKHGPTAGFWHALRLARDRGIPILDFGGAEPTDDPHHIHFSITDFKRRWGGHHVAVPGAEAVLARTRVALQDRLLKPFWDRAHPFYLRMFDQTA